MKSITHAPGNNASTRKSNRISHSSPAQGISHLRGVAADPRHTQHAAQLPQEEPESNTLLIEDATLSHGFVLLPKLVLYARNLSRDAKLLYAVLLGYAWQEGRCFPGYTRLCDDLDASENMVRKYMRELEAVHLLSQRRRGLGRTNIYTLHDLRTSKIEVQEPHQTAALEPHQTAALEPQESDDYEETEEIKTDEIKNRTMGERPVLRVQGHPEHDEKALGGGQPTAPATTKVVGSQSPNPLQSRPSTRDKQAKEREVTPREEALAQARAVAGAGLQEQLSQLGGSNPVGGVETILEAMVEVQTPVAVLGALLDVGERRLAQQQELSYIPNPTGYLIGIMRNLAVEAWLKGWKIEQIQAEDEEKHAQALRAAQRGGSRVLGDESETCPAAEEAPPPSDVVECPPSAVPPPAYYLPGDVEVADAATVSTWQDHLPDPETSQPRAVSMLWGFVRDAISDHLSIARRGQLEALVSKWDAARPRTLLLLCNTTYGARAVELNLRREIEPLFGKLLSRFFDEFQVVFTSGQEEHL